jgi:hypothetical protein
MPRPVRVLFFLVMLAAFAPSASAGDFWGRKLPDQPVNFIFGYGSLISSSSRESTAGAPIHAIPARISAGFGYIRSWNDRSRSGFTALGLRRPEPGEEASTINGVVYPVAGNDMAAFDAREAGYVRVEVPPDKVEAVSWERLPEIGKIWVYIPGLPGKAPGVDLPLPDAAFPMLESYIDVVIEGALEYGPGYAQEVIQTTKDWSGYWLNDRELARRPWVFDRKYGAVDKLLSALAPHFVDRLFPEQYAARNLIAQPQSRSSQ